MKKLIITLALLAALCMSANAADYEFTTAGDTEYYGSTEYESYYDSSYNYGGMNEIDYDIPEIRYGLAQEFLESSLYNPYMGPGVQYGFSYSGALGDERIAEIVSENFDLRPAKIIAKLDLRRPIYRQCAAYGHLGRTDIDLPWERLDAVDLLKKYC